MLLLFSVRVAVKATCLRKSCSSDSVYRFVHVLLSLLVRNWIVLVPDHCPSFYFS